MDNMEEASDWLNQLWRPLFEDQANVSICLRDGQAVGRRELSRALLHAMRMGQHGKHFQTMCLEVARRVVEDSLREAWRTAGALGLNISLMTEVDVRNLLSYVRYWLSGKEPRISPKLVSKPKQQLRVRVDQMLEYARRLEDELSRFQDGDFPDCCVLLAKQCALAIHGLKAAFKATYWDVPWEEAETLLAEFVEAQCKFKTLAFLVATPRSTAAHLRCFREKVEQHVMPLRDAPTPKPVGEEKTRDDLVETLDPDSGRGRMHQDFTLLRDSSSLRKITEALDAAREALKLDDASWTQWGWLSLRYGLFVVGEKMKNTWQSPNLSRRCSEMLDIVAPDGVMTALKRIRDEQEHGKGTNARSMTLLTHMDVNKRQKLNVALGRVLDATRLVLREAEYEVLREKWNPTDFDMTSYNRVLLGISELTENTLDEQLIRQLTELTHSLENKEEIYNIINELKEIAQLSQDVDYFLRVGKTQLSSCSFTRRNLVLDRALVATTKWRSLTVMCHSGTNEHIDALAAYLCEPSLNQQTPLECTIADLRAALDAIPGKVEKGTPLHDYSILGGLREVASLWHVHVKDTDLLPATVPFSTTLVGRGLRNYLNHMDKIVDLTYCMSKELESFDAILTKGREEFDLAHGARPKERDPNWSGEENMRLLRLVELKGTLFQCARQGDLARLRHVLEEEQDLLAAVDCRDCQGRSLLHAAAQADQLEVVQWLLGLGDKQRLPIQYDWCGFIPMVVAKSVEVAEVLAEATLRASDREIAEMHARAKAQVKNANAQLPPWLTLELNVAVRKGENAILALCQAASFGRVSVAEVFFRVFSGKFNFPPSEEGPSPLDSAAKAGHEDMVDFLLRRGARLTHATSTRGATLTFAACSRSGPTVRRLLEADPAPSDADCWAAAEWAALVGAEQTFPVVLDELLRRGLLTGLWMQEALGLAVLRGIAVGGSSANALLLLDHCPADALTWGIGDAGLVLLDWAAAFGSADLVRDLLIRGADPLRRDDRSLTALHRSPTAAVVDALVEHINADHSLRTGLGEEVPPLFEAVQRGHVEVVKKLLQHGANPDACAFGDPHLTPLSEAAQLGRTEVVRALLEKGASVRLDPEQLADNPLTLAAGRGHLGVVKLLLPDDKNKKKHKERLALLQYRGGPSGGTALHLAVVSGNLSVVKHLLKVEEWLILPYYRQRKHNAKAQLPFEPIVFARDHLQRTPLMMAVFRCVAPRVIDALLKHVETKEMKDMAGKDLQTRRGYAMEALRLVGQYPEQIPSSSATGTVRELNQWLRKNGEESQEFREMVDGLENLAIL